MLRFPPGGIMDILKRLRIERNALLKKAKSARKEAAQLLKHMKVIQDIERGIEKGRNTGKRKMSAAARAKISRAQKARWAAKRKG
jgi:hypothetical protein